MLPEDTFPTLDRRAFLGMGLATAQLSWEAI